MDFLALCGVGKGLSLCLELQADRVRWAPFACALLMHVPKPPAVANTPQLLLLFSLSDLGYECSDGLRHHTLHFFRHSNKKVKLVILFTVF